MKTLLLALLFFQLNLAWSAKPGRQWRENHFPNVPLVTHNGKKVHFYSDLIKNKVVAISFIFTSCKGPCPAETANLRQVEKILGDRVGRDVFMYSISIDPETDTPDVLKDYSKKFNAGPGWTFLTGKKEDSTLIREKLGVYSAKNKNEKLADHNISFVVGNEATGRWMKRSPFDNPKVLALLLGTSLQSLPVVKVGKASYASAPSVPSISKGEDLFRSRCISCHSMGKDDGVGPGLADVMTRRDRVWVARWLKDPEQLLVEKDPTALALLARYKKLQMPNLKLNDDEVQALMTFMESFRHF